MSSLAPPKATALKITLHVYSGRPNPFWFIPAEAAQELIERIGKISSTANVRPSASKGGLGYRGFSIEGIESQISWFVNEGIVDLGHAAQALVSEGREIEQWLLDVGGSIVSSALQSHVGASLAKPSIAKSAVASAGG